MSLAILLALVSCYLFSALLFGGYLKSFSNTWLRVGRWILGGGVVLHLSLLAGGTLEEGAFISSSLFTTHLKVTALGSIFCWSLSFRKNFLTIVVVALVALALMLLGSFWGLQEKVQVPLPSVWLWAHIALMILGEVFFLFAAATSLVYLFVEKQLRHHEASGLFGRISSLDSVHNFLGELLLGGFVWLSLGMILGFFFARHYWSGSWVWDPKVLFCLLTWIVYACLLGMRFFSNAMTGKKTAILAVAGFVAVLFLSIGVTVLFPSQHPLQEIEYFSR